MSGPVRFQAEPFHFKGNVIEFIKSRKFILLWMGTKPFFIEGSYTSVYLFLMEYSLYSNIGFMENDAL